MTPTASLARSALSNLAVNTFGTPAKATPLAKELSSRKRSIDQVEEPENAQAACKVLVSASCVRAPVSASKADLSLTPRLTKGPSAKSPPKSTNMPEDAPSPHSTVSSHVEYDLDDTIESQQTAATEITQPLAAGQVTVALAPTRVRQHAETLRLRLRLAQFKVQTNQINIPFSQLRLSAPSSQSPTEGSQRHSSASSEPDEEEAEGDAEEHPTLPHLLPAAQFHSSSLLSSIREPVVPALDPSSSPRKSESPDKDHLRTPVLPRPKMGRDGETMREENVTSSVVKGSAAMGLLGLRGKR